ncbi:hypothetical protein [Acinetobacter seifertii]|uniref:hypothetical protein n=1 Tax=Acinetobacter seifertii TaxID=1530123 RepID=UPI0012501AAB|nr:hypothetical protein [Acinetobacter seifertii]
MKPEHFIREYGVEKAREVVATGSDTYVFRPEGRKKYTQLSINDLKRLVESVDLVESWGGIEDLKLYDLSHCKDKPESAGYKLLKAIADYESIYGGGDD